jgi:hypothetical protein
MKVPTLGADTLNVQSLQEGHRMIGVISHVVDLADRLPARIQVVKGIGGSTLSVEGERQMAKAWSHRGIRTLPFEDRLDLIQVLIQQKSNILHHNLEHRRNALEERRPP